MQIWQSQHVLFCACVFGDGKGGLIRTPEFAGQAPPETALAAHQAFVVSAAKKAALASTSGAESDIPIPSSTSWVRGKRPQGVTDYNNIEML